ncbi:MAG: efflux RND transporter permease subunit [Clostridia bacterium]|nr:efflux RND transporter permease subunit [Clostridia bacterium]
MKLSELSVKRPVGVIMAVLIFVVIGLYSVTMLPMAMMPEMELPIGAVITQYPNVGAQEVENLVTKTVESALGSVSGVSGMTSQSSEGLSLVMLEFDAGIDIDDAITNVKDQVSLIEDYLPEECEEPMILKLDMSMMASAMFTVTYEGYDPVQTKKFVDDNVVDKLESIAGVASVSVAGAEERQFEIVVEPDKIFGYNLNLSSLVGAIATQNQNLPAGSIEGLGKDMNVRVVNKFKDLYDIEAVPVTLPTGQVIYIRDIASVYDTYSDTTTYSRTNGLKSISLSVTQESDANTVDVVNAVLNELDSISEEHSKFSYVTVFEQGSYIENAIGSVAESAVMGAILAIIILLLFLGSFRTSMVIGLTMPVAVVTTFIGMFFSGMTLNVVSLGGLALGVGMLVDNAVVVIENIFRRRSDLGEDNSTAAIKGAGEVLGAVVASVLTTCIVYVPVLFIDNMVATMFKQLAFTIIFSQLSALLVTYLLVPMLSSKIETLSGITQKRLGFIFKPFDKFMAWVYKAYEKAIRVLLKRRKRFIAATLAVFVLAMVVLMNIGMTLMPSSDEGMISISVELPKGSRLEDTNRIALNVENTISQNEYVDTIATTVGGGSMSAILGAAQNSASVTVTLKDDRDKTTADVLEELRASLSNVAGAVISLEASNTAMAMMSSDAVEFSFAGDNDETLEAFVLKAEELLKSIPTVTETSTSISETQPEVRITPKTSAASRYGLTAATLNALISQAIGETTATRLTQTGSEYNVVVKYPDSYVKDYSNLGRLRLTTPYGTIVSLGEVADIEIAQGSTTLTRVDQKRTITLSGKFYDDNLQSVTKKFEDLLATVEMPEGISMVESGTYEVMMDAMESLLLAIIIGILLMYMVMAAQFESFSEPFIVLFTLPLAMIGVVISLLIVGEPLSVIGCVGILMLSGIIVNNAIVLIDFIKTLRQEKPAASRTDIIVESCKTRLRPILMTTLTSILGFLPMALSTAEGSEMMRPLATVLLGGLGIGSLLTLFFIPVVFSIFDDWKNKRDEKKAVKDKYKKALSE